MIPEIAESSIILSLGISLVLIGSVALVGLFVSLLQAATQIQDQTLLFVPKFIALVSALFLGREFIGAECGTLFFDVLKLLSEVRP
jgi:flagellar biosynthetic protein FliQ